MKKITSKDNSVFKELKKLQQKKYRDVASKYLVFGEDLVDEARKSGLLLQVITLDEKNSNADILFDDVLFNVLQGNDDHKIGALVARRDDYNNISNKVLVLDAVQDPSNVGVLLRSAQAFGFNTVVRSKTSADFYNEKTVRASKGAVCHLNLLTVDLAEFLENKVRLGYRLYISEINDVSHDDNDQENIILVLGNEGSGVSENLKTICHTKIHIRTSGVESLNVGVAGSILMHELTNKK
jgi:TrmH family RNA methyltransferase